MITLRPSSSVSNSLSSYCFGRILASRIGYRFSCPQLRNRVRNWEANGRSILGEQIAWIGQWPFALPNARRVIPEEFTKPPGMRICLADGFNRTELFAAERERIRGEWLVPVDKRPARNAADFAVCLQSATFVIGERQLPPEGGCLTEKEIRKLVKTVRNTNLVLITDRSDHPLIKQLANLSPESKTLNQKLFLWESIGFLHFSKLQRILH